MKRKFRVCGGGLVGLEKAVGCVGVKQATTKISRTRNKEFYDWLFQGKKFRKGKFLRCLIFTFVCART